ncbi:hypothetical protein A3F27_03280 [Candidatus Kaiserbacteria bacterium RIFCSPHIGHO2_12_FULL_53_13]|uniref:Uncharacterized protein n=1 Tax=Candidatus Kaiserbacteria bacterium RIFCSPHIGHO2_12_FULL_53_13 TaxID=1798502 RepID=A0A1F6E8W3_9BACT|nr:MAG: hypothetical protein A3F27_03280 [Candidatus Kaiserbacteria bacterium RIFCSPHIGHO2_12_FULL_53_13]OGG74344.1 MAG: hypothetical protein A3A37_02585 [Candidatus Kaiserbacteria bacterium RIFCSPLOWO2_01_FULL_52_36]
MPQSKIFGIFIVLLILIGAAVLLSKKPLSNGELPVPQTQESTESSTIPPAGISITPSDSSASSSYTISPIPVTSTAPAPSASSSPPSLTKDVAFSGDISAPVKNILSERIAKYRTLLSKNYSDLSTWMNLAIQYKTAGDYDSAREVWEYISRTHPRDITSLHNLGDLYQNFLKDYAKAESYYKLAISINPTQSINYLALHEIYRYSYRQDTSAAVDILKSGFTKVAGNQAIDLYTALGSYYESKNDKANAIVYYTKARDAVQKLGNTALVAQLDSAIAVLKQ